MADTLNDTIDENRKKLAAPAAASPSDDDDEDDAKQVKTQATDAASALVSNDPLAPPSKTEYLNAVTALQNFKRSAPTSEATNWDAKIDEAKQLYKDSADRNAWLSLAQTIGQSVVKLASANEGLARHVNMANVDLGPGYDVEAANKRNLEEYKTELGNINQGFGRAQIQNAGQQRAGELSDADQLKGLEAAVGAQKDIFNEASNTQRTNLHDTTQMNRYAQMQAASDARADRRETEATTKDTIKNLDQTIKDNQKKLQSANELSNLYANYDELKKKDKEGTEKRIGDLAGKSGVSSDDLEAIKTKSKEGTGVLGLFQSEDPKVKAQLLQQKVVAPLQQELQRLEEQRRQVAARSSGAPAQAPAQSAQPAAPAQAAAQSAPIPSDRVKVRSADGKIGTIPRSQLDDAKSQGYTEVQ